MGPLRHNHVEPLCKSFRSKDNQVKRLRCLPANTRKTIYFSSIVPTVTYCNLVWGTSSPSLVNKIDHTNAGAAKIVFRLRNDISDKDAFAGTRWLSISDLYKVKLFNAYEQCAH